MMASRSELGNLGRSAAAVGARELLSLSVIVYRFEIGVAGSAFDSQQASN